MSSDCHSKESSNEHGATSFNSLNNNNSFYKPFFILVDPFESSDSSVSSSDIAEEDLSPRNVREEG